MLKNVIFIINRDYTPESRDRIEANLLRKIVKIAANKPTIIFQTNAGTTSFALLVKSCLGSQTDLINIVSTGNIQLIVSITINYMKKYLLKSQEILILFIDNKNFIFKFIKRYFKESFDYYPNSDSDTDPDNFRVYNCEAHKLR